MNNKDKKAVDDLVRETLQKVRSGRISREEGREEIELTLRRHRYDADVVEYALKEYHIYC